MTRPRRLPRALTLGVLAVTVTAALTACSATADLPGTLNRAVNTRGLTVATDQRYGPDARNVLDVYAPPSARNAPIVLFVHGGSWQGGDKAIHRFVGESLARAGYVTGVMNYRLAPQNRYPAFVQDAASALRWLRDNGGKFGGDPDVLFMTGHSAGAFNAVEAVDNERWLREAGVPIRAVRGVIGIAGPYSYDFRQFDSRVAFPEGSTPDQVMPDRHVRRDAPPHLLLVAANDTTVYPQNALSLEAALRRAGVPVTRTVLPRLNHVTIIAAVARPLTFLGGTRQQMIDFIEKNRPR
ncbi:alpha/beta hydrolase [Deinococcus sp. YIM 134068]|uniref:alpha/beta hydrolase n=1 Tax=Deinococcus lichenicola TaxID=3118910 RepID=UPI002F937A69